MVAAELEASGQPLAAAERSGSGHARFALFQSSWRQPAGLASCALAGKRARLSMTLLIGSWI